MPESPEIAIMRDCLAAKLNGKLCSKIIIMSKYKNGYEKELYSSSKLNYNMGEGYKWLDVNSNLSRITSRGKKIIFQFDKDRYEAFRFVSSCGMDGHWLWEQTKYTALILIFDGIMAFYEEKARGGNFSVCHYPSVEYDHIFKDVGPDLMTDEVTLEVYYFVIKNKRIQNLKIGEFMMQQKYLSGIGNYLRSEILYKSKISPHRSLNSLSDTDIHNIFYNTKMTIYESYRSNGLTIQSYVSPNGLKGTYQCLCYGRDIDNYGSRIITEKDKNNRTIHWCQNWQV